MSAGETSDPADAADQRYLLRRIPRAPSLVPSEPPLALEEHTASHLDLAVEQDRGQPRSPAAAPAIPSAARPFRAAVISDDELYRYELRRTWDPATPGIIWVMLNPSRADAEQDDPTIRRCVAFSRAWGYGAITVRNLFALRATDPTELRKHPDPVGPDNDRWLLSRPAAADTVIACAWGAHGSLLGRDRQVLDLFADHGASALHHLGLTLAGAPRHPLYLRRTTTPIAWAQPRPLTAGRARSRSTPAATRAFRHGHA